MKRIKLVGARLVSRRFILPGVILILLALGIYGFFTFNTVRTRLNSGVAHFQAAVNLVKSENSPLNLATLNLLKQELSAAELDFRQAREAAGPASMVLPLLSWLPGPAYDLSRLPILLELGEKIGRAGNLILEGLRPSLAAFDTTGIPGSPDAGGKLTQVAQALALPQAQDNFKQATSLLTEINHRLSSLDRSRLSLDQTRKAVNQLDQQLPGLRDGLELAQQLPPLLPALLGTADKPVNYLILIQNSDELRATGGFISAAGLITFDNGKFVLSNFSDSYALDNPKVTPEAPPEPLSRYMKAGSFLLRDANWWPDFPTSARKITELYKLHQGLEVANVMAVDSQAVAYLFEALGPLDLPAYNEHLTAQNFEERLRYYYLPPGTDKSGDWWSKRKQFTGIVFANLLGMLNGASPHDYLRVATWLGRAFTEKHLQFYSNNPALENQLRQRKLDGAQISLPPVAATNPSSIKTINDYLMVVDSNVGFNKVNPQVERTSSYRISSGGPGANLFASLTLTYTNRAGVREGTPAGECVKVVKYDTSYESMMNGCYWNYLRVYVPAGSRLRQSTDFPADDPPVTGQENNLTFFASQLIVPPGSTVTITLDYLLPGVLPGESDYQLTVQHQAGSRPGPWTINVDWPGYSRQWKAQLDRDLVFKEGIDVLK